MQGDPPHPDDSDLHLINGFSDDSFEETDQSFDDNKHRRLSLDDITIADLPDSEREKVSRLVEKLVSLGREQEELIADLAYERSRHANEIETSSQMLQQQQLRSEYEKGQLELQLAESKGKRRSALSLLHLYQVSIEKHATKYSSMSDASATKMVAGLELRPDSLEFGREQELKDSVSRMEILSNSQQAMIDSMQTAHSKVAAAHKAAVAELAASTLKLAGTDEKLRDCESQLVQALSARSDSVAVEKRTTQEKQYLDTMERACEGMARQLAEMAQRLQEKEVQIAALSVQNERNGGNAMNVLIAQSASKWPPSPTHTKVRIGKNGGDAGRENSEENNSHCPSPVHKSSPKRTKGIRSKDVEVPSRKNDSRSSSRGKIKVDDGHHAVKSARYTSDTESKDEESVRAPTAGGRDYHNPITVTSISTTRSSLDNLPLHGHHAPSPTISQSPGENVRGLNRGNGKNEAIDIDQHRLDRHSVKQPGAEHERQRRYLCSPDRGERGWPPPFPTRSAAFPPSPPKGGVVDRSHSPHIPGYSRNATNSITRNGGDKVQTDKKIRRVQKDMYGMPAVQQELTSSSNSSLQGYGNYNVALTSSSSKTRKDPSLFWRLSQSHKLPTQSSRSGGILSHSHKPDRTKRTPTPGSILTINGSNNHVLHHGSSIEREKQQKWRQQQDRSEFNERGPSKNKSKGFYSFDGERDEYDPQLFDLLDKIEIHYDDC